MFINKLDDVPLAGDDQTIVVTSEADPSIKMPRCRLTFQKGIDDKGMMYIKQGFAEITDRSKNSCKEYPLADQDMYFYYNDEKQICSFLCKEDSDGEEKVKGSKEIVEFLNLTKDEEAIQAYRFLSFYWATLSVGLSFVTGNVRYEMPTTEEIDLEGEEEEG